MRHRFGITNAAALAILFVAGMLAYTSAWSDAAIVDEDPHIGAGISYVTERDMRINPEHPPLVKDLAALPLLLIPDLAVPTSDPSWTHDINGQWDFGRAFLFQSGNNADTILRLARIAPILIMLLLGWFIFRWARERAGVLAAFLALIFYVSSPVVLAHGRFVTTDVPAAAGIFIATYFFIRYLTRPSMRALLTAGVVFGFAQLMKFSAVLLVPYFAVLAVLWLLAVQFSPLENVLPHTRTWMRNTLRYLGGVFLMGLIGLLVISLVYAFHVAQYPLERQLNDMRFILQSFPNQTLANVVLAMAGIDVLRPLAQYFFGFLMVVQRAVGGNTTYFLGEVSAAGWTSYFPIVYLIKLPLAFHVLTLIAAALGVQSVFRAARACIRTTRLFSRKSLGHLAAWIRSYFIELAMLVFIALYWFTSLTSNLNIGVRHLIPTLPFMFVLVAIGTRAFVHISVPQLSPSAIKSIRAILKQTFSSSIRTLIVLCLVLWMLVTGLAAWPFYLASFNELAFLRGGGQYWAVDSNLDWGQDLKRLARFVEEREIDRIAVDYFGWTPPAYYIQTAQVVPWDVGKGQPSGWFAVSATYKQQACARPASGFQQDTTGYCFLNNYRPEAVIGGSIYVYKLP